MKISFSQTKEGAQRLRELVPQYPQICLTCSSPRPGIPEPTPHEVEGQGDPTNDFFRERPKIVKVSDPFKARGANRRGEKLRNNEIKQRGHKSVLLADGQFVQRPKCDRIVWRILSNGTTIRMS